MPNTRAGLRDKGALNLGGGQKFRWALPRQDRLPTLDEVETNYYLLKPVLKLHPAKRPSTFAIADALLMLDGMTNGLLLKNVGRGERQPHALREARGWGRRTFIGLGAWASGF